MFPLRGSGGSLASDGRCTQDTKLARTRDFSRVVFFVCRVSACQRLSHAQHVHVAQALCPHKNICLHS